MKTNIIILLLCMALGYAVPMQTIGIDNKEVLSFPRVMKIELKMQSEGRIYLLDNPEIGVHKTELKDVYQTKYRYGVKIYRPILPEVVNAFDFKWWVNDPNIVDYAGTGRSFGFGIIGKWSDATILVNEKEYNFKPIVDMVDLVEFLATWNPEPNIPEPNIPEPNVVDINPVIEPNVIEPNEPPVQLPMVWVSQTGTKYHLKTCRYWRDNFQEISIFDAMLDNCTPCLVCKPDERTGQ